MTETHHALEKFTYAHFCACPSDLVWRCRPFKGRQRQTTSDFVVSHHKCVSESRFIFTVIVLQLLLPLYELFKKNMVKQWTKDLIIE